VQDIILNFNLHMNFKLEEDVRDPKSLRFEADNFSSSVVEKGAFVFRFMTVEKCQRFREAVASAMYQSLQDSPRSSRSASPVDNKEVAHESVVVDVQHLAKRHKSCSDHEEKKVEQKQQHANGEQAKDEHGEVARRVTKRKIELPSVIIQKVTPQQQVELEDNLPKKRSRFIFRKVST
jgi:hypothetical protein